MCQQRRAVNVNWKRKPNFWCSSWWWFCHKNKFEWLLVLRFAMVGFGVFKVEFQIFSIEYVLRKFHVATERRKHNFRLLVSSGEQITIMYLLTFLDFGWIGNQATSTDDIWKSKQNFSLADTFPTSHLMSNLVTGTKIKRKKVCSSRKGHKSSPRSWTPELRIKIQDRTFEFHTAQTCVLDFRSLGVETLVTQQQRAIYC